ncbi:hypothetical protein ASG56_16115 [Rhodococcus sp. Leaf7]|uniref:MFS transporter n=1 Tax=unclassified Rhodococcus (in: high G+C Gram-positive bacteria) TaxID=192944 RepID=UPI0006FCF3CC|nr:MULTISPECIES: MFS transporter [unclassified Rhodococcus (in: high G+C Gram-positive bacteria)]KQU02488.1 hypothetical protein ASG56_16115 [Rhodococcus sp. Leaf7]KQU37959.1 hypothetical protein ASG64_18845 [Rhodococcus sp. Leaf247]
MTAGTTSTTGRPWAVAVVFFVNGAVLGNWAPRIPAIRDALSLDASVLGLALAGTGTGGLLATPLAAIGIRKLGSRMVVVLSAALLCLAFVLPAVAGTWWMLALSLAVLGGADAVMDVAMNAQGVIVEKRRDRSLLNRFHASWSAGAVTGGLTGAAAAAAGLSVVVHFSLVGGVLLVAAVVAARFLVRDAPTAPAEPVSATPRRSRVPFSGALALLGLLVLVAALVEDVPQSWGAVYSTELGAGAGLAGLSVVAFSSAMFVGRLIGDATVDRFGRHAVLMGGALLIAAAFVAAPAVTSPYVAAAMFAVAGLGAAPIFPAAFGLAGRLPGIAPGTAMTVVSLVARVGVLTAPITFGTLAQLTGFGWALWSVVAAGVAVALVAIALRRVLAASPSHAS